MSEIVTRTRRKRKPSRIAQERRRNLIDAAIRNIASQGYDAVTIATICEEAGFSRGLVGHYFSGKDHLLLEAVKTVAAELGDAIRQATIAVGSDPTDKLHALVHASFTPPGFTPEKVAVWVSLTGAARWSPALAEVYREIWRDYRAGIGRLLSRVAEGVGTKIDTQSATIGFSQMVEGLWVGWAADPDAISPAAAEACCHHYLNMVLSDTSKKYTRFASS